MRQVTATEKYRAVNEGKMAKGEFVRQMRMSYPTVISQWNSYNDTVTILKNRGYISEKTGVDTYDSRYDLNISPDSIDRGVRFELAGQGVDPTEALANRDEALLSKIQDRVVKNLKKDPLHYINLLAKESSKTDKHDREEEVKRGEAKKDVFNGEKKADLREGIEIQRENIIAVAKEIRAKYGDIPGFNGLLKDFLQTHQQEIKAGEVKPEDAIAEFDNFVDANYDRLNEKDHDGYNTDPNTTMHIDDEEWEQEMGRSVKEKKGKDHDGDGDIDSDDYMAAKDKAIKKAMGTEEGQINERGFHVMRQIKGIIQDMAADFDGDEVGAAEELMEAIGQEYGIDFEFGAGESRQQEALRESVKNIITKVLEEQVINEAATAELARLADDYAEFEGMKQSIIALQDIVTDIESYYDKTRDKIQKVYDSIGEIRNEEGLKVGAFIAPSIEAAFNKDLRPAVKRGFTAGLETPKVKTISKADIDAARAAGDIEEEPKQTLFTPVNENKK